MRAESCERPESDRRQEEKCVGEPGLATNRERERERERERGHQTDGTEERLTRYLGQRNIDWRPSSDLVSGNDVIIRAVLWSVPLFV